MKSMDDITPQKGDHHLCIIGHHGYNVWVLVGSEMWAKVLSNIFLQVSFSLNQLAMSHELPK